MKMEILLTDGKDERFVEL